MTLRQRLARTLAATLIFIGASVAVGLTSPADGPFSIGVRPVFLGVEVDVKIGTLQLHYGWSAFELAEQRSNERASISARRSFPAESASRAVAGCGDAPRRRLPVSTKPASALL